MKEKHIILRTCPDKEYLQFKSKLTLSEVKISTAVIALINGVNNNRIDIKKFVEEYIGKA